MYANPLTDYYIPKGLCTTALYFFCLVSQFTRLVLALKPPGKPGALLLLTA